MASSLLASLADATIVFSGPAWVADADRQTECRGNADGVTLTIEGGGTWIIAPDGREAARLDGRVGESAQRRQVRGRRELHIVDQIDIPARVQEEVALGPVLLLCLARQGTHALHASAVVCGGWAIAFVGESGCGKSTLARYLGESSRRWRRIGDDILPIAAVTSGSTDPGSPSATSDGVEALPHFPQLKLSPDEQPGLRAPERLPLAAVYVLEEPETRPGGDGADERVSIGAMPPGDAALTLAAHTVPAKLFDRDLLAKHTAFVAGAIEHVAVRRISYPRKLSALDMVELALARDFELLVG